MDNPCILFFRGGVSLSRACRFAKRPRYATASRLFRRPLPPPLNTPLAFGYRHRRYAKRPLDFRLSPLSIFMRRPKFSSNGIQAAVPSHASTHSLYNAEMNTSHKRSGEMILATPLPDCSRYPSFEATNKRTPGGNRSI